jgi:hypothetical protein
MSRKRRLLAIGGLVVLVALSGCSIFGGGEISDSQLNKNASYSWDTDVNASYNVTKEPLLSFSSDEYRAVITVRNQSTVSVHRESLIRGDQPVSIEALQFEFHNESVLNETRENVTVIERTDDGPVVDARHPNLTAIEQSDETEMRLPADNGTVGYTAEWGGAGGLGSGPRTWRVRTPVDGSHNVTMPKGARTAIPLLSATAPGGHSTTVENDRERLHWDDLSSSTISVRYYLLRDLYIFGGLLVIGIAVGGGGAAYYYRQIQQAREKRQEVGLDVEQDDDDDVGDDGPPPGVR